MKDIVGNKSTLAKIFSIAKSGEIGHAYLLSGQENIGKTEIAKELARVILCSNGGDPKCSCNDCRLVSSGQHPDAHFLDSYNSNIEEVRELMHSLELKPYQAKNRVAIVSHIDRLSAQALNSFLKTLEEPFENTVIILTAENKANILSTVISRVRTINLYPATFKEVFEHLNLECGVKKELALEISRISGGKVGLAIRYSEDPEEAAAISKDSEEFIRRYFSSNLTDQIVFGDMIASKKDLLEDRLDYYINYIYAKMNESRDKEDSLSKYIKILDGIAKAKVLLRQNVNTKMVAESLMMGSL